MSIKWTQTRRLLLEMCLIVPDIEQCSSEHCYTPVPSNPLTELDILYINTDQLLNKMG